MHIIVSHCHCEGLSLGGWGNVELSREQEAKLCQLSTCHLYNAMIVDVFFHFI